MESTVKADAAASSWLSTGKDLFLKTVLILQQAPQPKHGNEAGNGQSLSALFIGTWFLGARKFCVKQSLDKAKSELAAPLPLI